MVWCVGGGPELPCLHPCCHRSLCRCVPYLPSTPPTLTLHILGPVAPVRCTPSRRHHPQGGIPAAEMPELLSPDNGLPGALLDLASLAMPPAAAAGGAGGGGAGGGGGGGLGGGGGGPGRGRGGVNPMGMERHPGAPGGGGPGGGGGAAARQRTKDIDPAEQV